MSGTTRDFPSLFFVCMAIIASRFSAGGQKRTSIYFQISSVGRFSLRTMNGRLLTVLVSHAVPVWLRGLLSWEKASLSLMNMRLRSMTFFFPSLILISSGLISNLNQGKRKKKAFIGIIHVWFNCLYVCWTCLTSPNAAVCFRNVYISAWIHQVILRLCCTCKRGGWDIMYLQGDYETRRQTQIIWLDRTTGPLWIIEEGKHYTER